MPDPLQANMSTYSLIEISTETPDVTMFRFRSNAGLRIKFDPGMFVMLAWMDPNTKERIARAFSLSNAPSDDYIEFIIHMIHGKFTSHLDTAKVSDTYYVTGPHGQFKFIPAMDKKVLFIAGGTGLAPFLSMIREIKQLKSGNDTVLLYSVRFPNEIIRKGELEQLKNDISMKMVVTVTRPAEGDGWTGITGHIDANMIKVQVADFMDRTSYICGPLPFVKAVKDALTSLGVPSEKIKADVWG